MVRRRTAALLLALALVLTGLPAGDAFAAIPTLKPTPPTPLNGPAPRAPVHHHTSPAPVPTTPTVTSGTVTTLPMTGIDLPLELAVAGLMVAAGIAAWLTSIRMRVGSRSYHFKSRRDRAARR
jgi:hypothetical protein